MNSSEKSLVGRSLCTVASGRAVRRRRTGRRRRIAAIEFLPSEHPKSARVIAFGAGGKIHRYERVLKPWQDVVNCGPLRRRVAVVETMSNHPGRDRHCGILKAVSRFRPQEYPKGIAAVGNPYEIAKPSLPS